MMRSNSNATQSSHPIGQAFRILQAGFVLVPILAGLDKIVDFLLGFHILGEWSEYLAPIFPQTLGIEDHTFMLGVGIIEILAGVLVAVVPRFGAYLVAVWLWAIVVNLLILGEYFDSPCATLGSRSARSRSVGWRRSTIPSRSALRVRHSLDLAKSVHQLVEVGNEVESSKGQSAFPKLFDSFVPAYMLTRFLLARPLSCSLA